MTRLRTRTAHRVVAVVAAIVGVAASIVVVAPSASAYAPITCQTRTWTISTREAPNMSWYAPGSFWKWGHFNVSQCRRGANWDPSGYAFDGQGDAHVRMRTYNANGNTAWVSDWRTAFGGGPTVRLAGMLAPGTRFSVEFRVIDRDPSPPDYQSEPYHPLGQVEF